MHTDQACTWAGIPERCKEEGVVTATTRNAVRDET